VLCPDRQRGVQQGPATTDVLALQRPCSHACVTLGKTWENIQLPVLQLHATVEMLLDMEHLPARTPPPSAAVLDQPAAGRHLGAPPPGQCRGGDPPWAQQPQPPAACWGPCRCRWWGRGWRGSWRVSGPGPCGAALPEGGSEQAPGESQGAHLVTRWWWMEWALAVVTHLMCASHIEQCIDA
jgi:hypothetical protein